MTDKRFELVKVLFAVWLDRDGGTAGTIPESAMVKALREAESAADVLLAALGEHPEQPTEPKQRTAKLRVCVAWEGGKEAPGDYGVSGHVSAGESDGEYSARMAIEGCSPSELHSVTWHTIEVPIPDGVPWPGDE